MPNDNVGITRQRMLECVMNNSKTIVGAQAFDRLRRLALEFDRGGREANGFRETNDPCSIEHWQDLGQDGSERSCSLGAVAFSPVDTRNEADCLRACRLRRLDQTADGCAPILIPVVEGIDLPQSDETQAALARHLARAHRLDPVKDWSAEIVSRLHADTAKLGGEVEKGREAKFRHRLLV